jgi:hypothetical protein
VSRCVRQLDSALHDDRGKALPDVRFVTRDVPLSLPLGVTLVVACSGVMGRRRRESISPAWGGVVAAALVGAVTGCGAEDLAVDRHGSLEGQVVVAGPLRGAKISIDQLHIDNDLGDVREHVADLVTDDDGRWTLGDTGLLNGLIRVTATGGEYHDRVSGATIILDDEAEVRSLFDVDLFEDRFLLVSPVGHLTESFARARLAAGTEANLWDARAAAAEHLDRHFGGVDWARVELADITQPATSPTEEVRAIAVHSAFQVLVEDFRLASGATPQEVHVYALMTALAADIAAPPLDGNDEDSRVTASGLQLGVCDPVPTDCVVPPTGDCGAACRSLCDVYSGTLRADFSGAMTKLLRSPSLNGTGLVDELVPVARALAMNADEVLFGAGCTGGLDRLPPTISWTVAPGDGAFVSGQVELQVRADDDIDPKVRVSWDGFDDRDLDPTNEVASLLLDTGRFVDGPFTITAIAVDQAGNRVESSRPLQADNTAPSLSMSSGGFVVTESAWWTPSSGPALTGEATDANGITLAVAVNGASVETSVANGMWTAALPPGALHEGRNTVRVVATDPAGNVTALVQELGVDTTPPVVDVRATTMADERTDTIAFGESGAPGHTHDAPSTTLGQADSCIAGSVPPVYRHAYLMVASPPATENVSNALRFVFRVSDGVGIGPDRQAAEYRVRVPSGAWGPWRSAGEGVEIERGIVEYTALLIRTEVPELATVEGQYEIEMRSRDGVGLTAGQARCWGHHPLASPLRITVVGQSNDTANALRKILLAENGRVASVLRGTVGAAWLVEFDIRNPTTDDVWVQLLPSMLPADVTMERDWREAYVVASRRAVNEQCGTGRGFPAPAGTRSDGAPEDLLATALNATVRLYEHVDGTYQERAPTNGRFLLRASTASGPREYKAVLVTSGIPAMMPWSGTVAEMTLTWLGGSAFITGELAGQITQCTQGTSSGCPRPPGEPQEYKCTERTTYQRYRAVERLDLRWNGAVKIGVSASVAPDSSLRPAKPTDSPSSERYSWTTDESGLPPL